MKEENSVLAALEVGKTYTAKQLNDFIAHDKVGSAFFCQGTLLRESNEEVEFTVEQILEGYLNKRFNDYMAVPHSKQKLYIIAPKKKA